MRTPLVNCGAPVNPRRMSETQHSPALASSDLLIAFSAYERAVLGLSEQTVRNHRTYLEAYLRWWRTGRALEPVTAATPGDVAGFLIAEAERGLAARHRATAPPIEIYTAAECAAILSHTGSLTDVRGRQRLHPASAEGCRRDPQRRESILWRSPARTDR